MVSKRLIIAGAVLILMGFLWPLLIRGPWGRLPGDIVVKKQNVTLYFPIATSLVLSVLLSVLLWFFKKR